MKKLIEWIKDYFACLATVMRKDTFVSLDEIHKSLEEKKRFEE